MYTHYTHTRTHYIGPTWVMWTHMAVFWSGIYGIVNVSYDNAIKFALCLCAEKFVELKVAVSTVEINANKIIYQRPDAFN